MTLIWRKDSLTPSLSRFLDVVADYKTSKEIDI
jgi:hypothetical protein